MLTSIYVCVCTCVFVFVVLGIATVLNLFAFAEIFVSPLLWLSFRPVASVVTAVVLGCAIELGPGPESPALMAVGIHFHGWDTSD